jgi:hypothetical protein
MRKTFNERLNESKTFYKENFNFTVVNSPQITEEFKYFLAGFAEGEGSLNVSIKKQPESRIGVYIDPEFSVLQHNRAPDNLFAFAKLFGTGTVTPGKNIEGPGSKADFSIGNRKALVEKVAPFYQQYVYPHCSQFKRQHAIKFFSLILLYEKGAHQKIRSIIDQLAPLVFQLRSSKARKDVGFADLQELKDYLIDHAKKKLESKNFSIVGLTNDQIIDKFDADS